MLCIIVSVIKAIGCKTEDLSPESLYVELSDKYDAGRILYFSATDSILRMDGFPKGGPETVG